jgi:hypothetical protein
VSPNDIYFNDKFYTTGKEALLLVICNGYQSSPKIYGLSVILLLSISNVVALSKLPSNSFTNKPVMLNDLYRLT